MVFQPAFRDAFSKRVHREFQAPKLSTQNTKTHPLGAKQEKAKKDTSKGLALSDNEYEIIDPISTDLDEDTVVV